MPNLHAQIVQANVRWDRAAGRPDGSGVVGTVLTVAASPVQERHRVWISREAVVTQWLVVKSAGSK